MKENPRIKNVGSVVRSIWKEPCILEDFPLPIGLNQIAYVAVKLNLDYGSGKSHIFWAL